MMMTEAKNSSRRSLLVRTSVLATAMVMLCGTAHAQGGANDASQGQVPAQTQGPAGAQPGAPGPAGPSKASKTNAAGEIVITGTALRASPDQVAVPVSVISSESIAKGGVSN